MKRIGKRLLGIVSLALAIALAAVAFPYVKDLAARLLPQLKYSQAATLIAHEMENAGELTALRCTDTEIMEATTDAYLIGTVQRVRAPYTYEIGLGCRLSEVTVSPGDDGITVMVPAADMLYDRFQVTGEPQIDDFWHLLTESRYQEMLNAQAGACREKYLRDEACLQTAWDASCEAIRGLITQWTGEEMPLTFVQMQKAAEEGEDSVS